MILHDASDKLSGLQHSASMLHDTAAKLKNLRKDATYKETVTEASERSISDSTTQLSETVRRLESMIAAMAAPTRPAAPRSPATPPTVPTVPAKSEWYWKAMVTGWAGWACFAFTMIIAWLNAKGH